MAVVNTITLSGLEGAKRVDAEYYQPIYLQTNEILSNIPLKKLSHVCTVTDGNHVAISDWFTDEGVRYLRGQDLTDFFISDADPVFIPEQIFEKLERSHIFPGDVLLSIVGTIGLVGIVAEDFDKLTANCKIAILHARDINPWFLAAFLASKYGQGQIKRKVSGAVQTGIILVDLATIKVPVVSNDGAVEDIERVLKQAYSRHKESKEKYVNAERLLLEELGLRDFEPEHDLTYSSNLSETFRAHRADAEFFQPLYQRVANLIMGREHCFIGEVKEFNRRGVQPIYVEDGEIKVVTSKRLGKMAIDYDNLERTTPEEWEKNHTAQLRQLDILIYTTGAYVGRTNCYLENDKAIASNHTNILRVNSLNPMYVAVFLNSILGQLQVKRFITGSAQAELYPTDIAKFVIWNAPVEIQERVASLVLESHEARKKAAELLQQAKREVEEAIESKMSR